MSAVIVGPIPVQVYEDIDAGIQRKPIVPASVNMDVEIPATRCLVTSASMGIGNKALHSTQDFEEGEKLGGSELRQNMTNGRRQASVSLTEVFHMTWIVEMFPDPLGDRGEVANDIRGEQPRGRNRRARYEGMGLPANRLLAARRRTREGCRHRNTFGHQPSGPHRGPRRPGICRASPNPAWRPPV